MAGVDVGGGQGGRSRDLNRDLNMVPFIDLLFVTIAFLLITAVWTTHARLEANAVVPGTEACAGDDCVNPPEKRLHLYVEAEGYTLAWKQGETVVSETRLASPDRAALEAELVAEWTRFGSHVEASDARRDSCVLHTDNSMPFQALAAVIDSVYAAKRMIANAGGEARKVPAFELAFASR